MSAMNRALIFEIGDISDEQSIRFLLQNGVHTHLMKKFLAYTYYTV